MNIDPGSGVKTARISSSPATMTPLEKTSFTHVASKAHGQQEIDTEGIISC